MTENHLKIFSIKSNLISNGKNDSLALGSQKNIGHSRPKNTYFSSMFQTIRQNIGLK